MDGAGLFLLFMVIWMFSILIVAIYVSADREREKDPVFMWVMFFPVIDTIYAIYLIYNIHKMINFKEVINKLKV